jgi:putative flavoprotein involved in K+ transport
VKEFDVVIIGAGQAGLSLGYYLQQTSLSFVLLDSSERVGESWRNRYDSLVLFTPKRYSSLPGMKFLGDPNLFPTKDETADYLEMYASHYSLPIHFQTTVRSLEKKQDRFMISTEHEEIYLARKVVVATGPFQKPIVPHLSKELSSEIYQVHSSGYRNPSQLKEGNVLVVGGGNSGAQIAVELARSKKTYLSISGSIGFMPLKLLGLSIFWYFDKLGFLQADITTNKGAWLQKQNEKVYGMELKELLRQNKVIKKPRVISSKTGMEIYFGDESSVTVQNIVWATGFRPNFSWVHIDGAIDTLGQPYHRKGVSPITDLFFLGLPWLTCRGSALLGWIGKDAKTLVSHLF